MTSAKDKLLKKMLRNVGKLMTRNELREYAGNVHEWQRPLRLLRQEGWDIETVRGRNGGYILKSGNKRFGFKRTSIDTKTRAAVLKKNGYKCVHCGRNPQEDGVKLVVDHIIPVDFGGGNSFDNLHTLCYECNHGKKHFFKNEGIDVMKKIFIATSNLKRLKIYVDSHPSEEIPIGNFLFVVKGREWTRDLRRLREYGYKIRYYKKGPKSGKECYVITKR